jgi:RHS repeat-associated protein
MIKLLTCNFKNQGDRLDINTRYYFESAAYSSSQYTVSNFLTQLANTFIFGAPTINGSLTENQANWSNETFHNNTGLVDFITNALQDQDINDPADPQSFLIYLFFDDKFEFQAEASGILQVEDPNTLGEMGILNLSMPKNGFFYVYTNNESSQSVNFNNLSIVHYAGVLIEENHYYPYGLLMEGITPESSVNGLINKYKYSNEELQLEMSLNQYHFGARFYDPVTGRFNVIDPLADFAAPYSSYHYAFNNPLTYNDPNGLWPEDDGPGDSFLERLWDGINGDSHYRLIPRENLEKNDERKAAVYRDYEDESELDERGNVDEMLDLADEQNNAQGNGGGNGGVNTDVIDEASEAVAINMSVKEGLIELAKKSGDIGTAGERYLSFTKAAGKMMGVTSTVTSWMEYNKNPTTGSFIKAATNTGLLFLRVNPFVGVGLGILDLTGGSDWFYNQVGNGIDNLGGAAGR